MSTTEKWKTEFYKLGPMRVEFADRMIPFITQLLETARKEERERVVKVLEGMKKTSFPRMGYTGESAIRKQALDDAVDALRGEGGEHTN